MISSIYVVILVVGVYCAPAEDEPVRVDLPVYEEPQATSPLEVKFSQSFEPENHPDEPRKNQNVDFVSKKLQLATNLVGDNVGYGIFSPPVTTRESAILETEGLGSKTLSIKENVEKVAVDLFQPKPLLDTIREEEKYGNSGDKFYSAGQAIVGGSSRLSKFINSILQKPGDILRQITRVTSEKLNNLGGKLVGL